MNEKIDQAVREAGSGLHDDPELQLEVQEELRCHLLDAVDAHKADGKDEAEAVDLALKDFGSSVELAGELQNANQNRMKARALFLLAVKALLIPTAIVFACASSYLSLRRLRRVQTLNSSLNTGAGTEVEDGPYAGTKFTSEERLILLGDTSRADRVAQQRAIWDANPEDPVYFGNYVTILITRAGAPTDEQIEEAVRIGNKMEPENSRYDYILANWWLDKGATIEYPDDDSKSRPYLKVTDRQALDKGMKYLLRATERPDLKTHSAEMLQRRLAILPEPESMEQLIARISISASVLLPDLSRQRQLARASVAYAQLLVSEGKKEEAIPYLRVCNDLSAKVYEDGFTLIDILVAGAVAGIADHAVTIAREAGLDGLADEIKQDAELLQKPVEDHKKRRDEYQDEKEWIHSASVLQGMLIPVMGEPIVESDLDSGRYLEYSLFEQTGLSALIHALFFAMLGFLLFSWVLSTRTEPSSVIPIFLLPQGRSWLRIVLIGVVCPFVVYILFTRFSGLSGRELGLRPAGFDSGFRFLFEIATLGLTIGFLSKWLAGRHVRKRCSELGIPVPEPSSIPAKLFGIAASLSMVLAMVTGTSLGMALGGGFSAGGDYNKLVVLGGVTLALLGLPALWVVRIMKQRQYRLFHCARFRTLVPILAVVTILVTVCHPLLRHEEKRLIQEDPIIGATPKGFTIIEDRVVQRLKDDALPGINRIRSRKK